MINNNQTEEIQTDVNIEDQPFFAWLANNIGTIIDYIDGTKELHAESLNTQYGKTIKPFGTTRLKLVELLSFLIKLNNAKIDQVIAEKQTFTKLMVPNWLYEFLISLFSSLQSLMKQYEWNSMLHNFIERIFVFALESDSEVLKKAVNIFFVKFKNIY